MHTAKPHRYHKNDTMYHKSLTLDGDMNARRRAEQPNTVGNNGLENLRLQGRILGSQNVAFIIRRHLIHSLVPKYIETYHTTWRVSTGDEM